MKKINILLVVFSTLLLYSCNKKTSVKQYMCEFDTYFEYQTEQSCSGFATAFVFRTFGDDVTGDEIYSQIEGKNEDGTVGVLPLNVYINSTSHSSTVLTGSLEYMNEQIAKGVPVIAFVKVAPTVPYYHYLSIVGFDKDNYYCVDSLYYMVTDRTNKNYNRVVTKEDMSEMLKINFYTSNTFLVLRK